MRQVRTKPIQQALLLEEGTKDTRGWGGKRKGAGRPPKTYRSSEPHTTRARFSKTTAVHVTLRVVGAIGNLRRREAYHAVRQAMHVVNARTDFRIVQISLEDDHVHAIVEADNDTALSKGIQAFQISAAQRINRALSKRGLPRRRGQVFSDRYHSRLITSPTQARHTLNYVLNNWRRHQQDQDIERMFWDVDYYSSGTTFTGWKELTGSMYELPEGFQPLPVARPHTWLLEKGWMKAGGELSMYAVPGAARTRRARAAA